MKKVALSTLLCLFYLLVKSQDTIYLQNGNIVIGKIVQIDEQLVKYSDLPEDDSLKHVIIKDDILKISYSNVSKKLFLREAARNSIMVANNFNGTFLNYPIIFNSGKYFINYIPVDNFRVDKVLKSRDNKTVNSLIKSSHRLKIASQIFFYSTIPFGMATMVYATGTLSKIEYEFPLFLSAAVFSFGAGIAINSESKSRRREAVERYNKIYFDY